MKGKISSFFFCSGIFIFFHKDLDFLGWWRLRGDCGENWQKMTEELKGSWLKKKKGVGVILKLTKIWCEEKGRKKMRNSMGIFERFLWVEFSWEFLWPSSKIFAFYLLLLFFNFRNKSTVHYSTVTVFSSIIVFLYRTMPISFLFFRVFRVFGNMCLPSSAFFIGFLTFLSSTFFFILATCLLNFPILWIQPLAF